MMGIFQKSVINKHLANLDSGQVEKAYQKFRENYNSSKINEIKKLKEEQYQDGFLRDIFVDVFGFVLAPDENHNLEREFKNVSDSKKADGAILKEGKAVAVIELKSTKTKDLKNVTEQAFGYKHNQPECKYVIISNFQKLQFYIDYANEYEEFDLFNLQRDEFELLYLLLNSESIFSDLALKLKTETKFHEENVSNKLYKDYSIFKTKLFENLVKNNPDYDKLTLFKKSQKLLDRFLFILFAEDSGLLPPNSITRIIEKYNLLIDLDEYKTIYEIYKQYFDYMNIGRKGKTEDDRIPAYNGGLFSNDELLDGLTIDDEILISDLLILSEYDFNTEVDVNILGHIFEHSLNEIEDITAEIEGTARDKSKSKRKKDGVFYTPKYITQYIVENTVGTLCKEKRKEFGLSEIEFDGTYKTKDGKLSVKGKKLFETLEKYKEWMLALKIVDPACGSGAFLNQALNFLIAEHKSIDDIIAELTSTPLRLFDTEKSILENNLYGVDINEESVEIAKLSLWLRTARKDRKLSNLNSNIKCGNSLIDDPEVAGDKAFSWNEEFKEIMQNGGFDVVIGNPPYAKYNAVSSKEKKYLRANEIYGRTGDLSEFFINRVLKSLLKKGAYFSFIVPKGLTYVKSWEETRSAFLNKVTLTSLFDVSKAFKDVLYEMIIFNIKNEISQSTTLKCGYFDDANKIEYSFEKKLFTKKIFYLGFPESYISFIKTINKKCENISNFVDFWYGKGGMTPLVNKQKRGISVLTGKEIGKYSFNQPKEKWFLEKNLLSKIDLARANTDKVVIQDIVAHIQNPKPHIKLTANIDTSQQFCLNTVMCFSENRTGLKNEFILAVINSKFLSFYFYYFVFNQAIRTMHFMPGYADILPIPQNAIQNQQPFIEKSTKMLELNKQLQQKKNEYLSRVKDNFEIEKLTKKLDAFYDYDFKTFVAELKKQRIIISLSEQVEWEEFFNSYKTELNNLQTEINKTDKEIDQMVYKLYGLTEEEIKIVEESIN